MIVSRDVRPNGCLRLHCLLTALHMINVLYILHIRVDMQSLSHGVLGKIVAETSSLLVSVTGGRRPFDAQWQCECLHEERYPDRTRNPSSLNLCHWGGSSSFMGRNVGHRWATFHLRALTQPSRSACETSELSKALQLHSQS